MTKLLEYLLIIGVLLLTTPLALSWDMTSTNSDSSNFIGHTVEIYQNEIHMDSMRVITNVTSIENGFLQTDGWYVTNTNSDSNWEYWPGTHWMSTSIIAGMWLAKVPSGGNVHNTQSTPGFGFTPAILAVLSIFGIIQICKRRI
jgi:hypothetical protein